MAVVVGTVAAECTARKQWATKSPAHINSIRRAAAVAKRDTPTARKPTATSWRRSGFAITRKSPELLPAEWRVRLAAQGELPVRLPESQVRLAMPSAASGIFMGSSPEHRHAEPLPIRQHIREVDKWAL